MKVLSLFDGMSCGAYALKKAGFNIGQYYASEIDKYAISIANKNHPEIIQMGCVKNIRKMAEAGVFGHIDLLIAGSPCQGFSFAGNQLAFNDPRSQLFFEFVYTLWALKKINPNIKFLLENVKMKKQHLDVITGFLGVEPILINSALVSAQNRNRYYWCNWTVTQPEDKGILLKDIIEYQVVEPENESWHKWWDKNKDFQLKKKYSAVVQTQEKAITMTARQYASYNGNFVEITGGAIRGRYNEDGTTDQNLEIRPDEKSNCLTTVSKDSLLINANFRQLQNVKTPEEKSKPLLATMHKGSQANGMTNITTDNISWRKLTPVECERLQTLPDDYTAGVSNSQRYKMLGNGWTAEVIIHILRSMPI